MTEFLSVLGLFAVLGSIGGLPAFLVAKFVSIKAGWLVLFLSAMLPLAIKYSESVNPAFGGWIVLAGPIWSGAVIAAGFLLFQTHRARTAQPKTKG